MVYGVSIKTTIVTYQGHHHLGENSVDLYPVR